LFLTIAAVVLAASVVLSGLACSSNATTGPSTTPAAAAEGQPTATNPIVIDKKAGEVRIAARVNAKALTTPTWHAVVYEKGKVSGDAVFQSYVSPNLVHAALKYMGGQPGDNLPMKDYNSLRTEGTAISIFVTWSGASKVYSLQDVVKDPAGASGKPIQARFGGNYDRIDSAGTGCETCFYSCPVGITSNAAYNGDDFARQKSAGTAGFTGNSTILPAPGTDVVIIYKVQA